MKKLKLDFFYEDEADVRRFKKHLKPYVNQVEFAVKRERVNG